MIVTLSFEEGLAAVVQGATQMMRAIDRHWVGSDHGGASGRDLRERWAQAIHGQFCEHAAAKALHRYPHASVNGCRTHDLGARLGIRGTPWSRGRLIVNEDELRRDGQPRNGEIAYVLVTGHWPQFQLRGWLSGDEIRSHDEWFHEDEYPPSWWVPHGALHPIETLPLLHP